MRLETYCKYFLTALKATADGSRDEIELTLLTIF